MSLSTTSSPAAIHLLCWSEWNCCLKVPQQETCSDSVDFQVPRSRADKCQLLLSLWAVDRGVNVVGKAGCG